MKHRYWSTAALALALGLSASPALAHETGESDPPVRYQCANGMTLEAWFLQVRGHGAVEVAFPDGRTPGAAARRLLPETQTGSGVRYASDITLLHVRSDRAYFETDASAQSEAIARTECTQVGAPAQEPITQAAQAGRYFVRHPDGVGYFAVETACFADDGEHFLALTPSTEPGQAVTFTGTVSRNAVVGPVDAGVGQRRYPVTAVEDPSQTMVLHFISPGMREADLPSATAGFSSISQGPNRVSCVDDDRIVYLATDGRLGMAVTVEDDGLAFHSFGGSGTSEWQPLRHGYVTQGEDGTVFQFFNRASRVRITASRNGALAPDALLLETDDARRSEMPQAYFIADPAALGSNLPSLDMATSQLLDRLALCNHYAGETGDDAARNAEIGRVWATTGCDAVPAAYDAAMAARGADEPLRVYLAAQSPNWL